MGTPGLLCVKLRMNRHRIAAMTSLLTNESINRPLFRGAHASALYFLIKKNMKITRAIQPAIWGNKATKSLRIQSIMWHILKYHSDGEYRNCKTIFHLVNYFFCQKIERKRFILNVLLIWETLWKYYTGNYNKRLKT